MSVSCPDLSGKCIMIVDDIYVNILVLEKMLSKTGATIVSFRGGREAINFLHSSTGPRPDLILLDLMMPDMNGFEVLEVLKGDPATADITVMIESADNTEEHIRKAKELGAVDFLLKPVLLMDLYNMVTAFI